MPTLAELINTVNERRQSVGKALGKLTPRQAHGGGRLLSRDTRHQ
jgi:hypothetical protein